MNQLRNEELIDLADAIDRHPLLQNLSVRTVRAWMKRGITRGGETVRLESLYRGVKLVTSLAAVDRFFAKLNPEPELAGV